MRSHPGQVSLPRRLDRRHRRLRRGGRAARGRGGDRARPGRRRGLRDACPSSGCRRATSRSPPSSAGGASPRRSTWSTRRRSTPSSGCRSRSCSTRTHRVTVVHPIGYSSPGFLIGDDKDLILWGFTAGLINRLFDHVGLDPPVGRVRGAGIARLHVRPEPRLTPSPGLTADLPKGPHELPRLVPGRADRCLRRSPGTGRASSRVPSRPPGCCSVAWSASGWPRSCSATRPRRCGSRWAPCSSCS